MIDRRLLGWLVSILIGVTPVADDIPGVGPQGSSQSRTAQIASLYESAMQDVNELLARAIGELASGPTNRGPEFRRSRAAQLDREIRKRLARLRALSTRQVDAETRAAISMGIRDAEDQLHEVALDVRQRTGSETTPGVSFAGVSSQAIDAIAEDTLLLQGSGTDDRLASAAADHAQRASGLFHRLSESPIQAGPDGTAEASVNRAIARGLVSGNTRIAQGAIRELFRGDSQAEDSYRKLGNQIIDVGLAKMTVRAYSEMVVRTRTREATVAGRHNRLSTSGISLVQINGRVSPNFCTAFIGLICSIDGPQTVDGVAYPALSELPQGGPPFHPNCSKGTTAYVPGVSSSNRATAHSRALRTFRTRQANGDLRKDVA